MSPNTTTTAARARLGTPCRRGGDALADGAGGLAKLHARRPAVAQTERRGGAAARPRGRRDGRRHGRGCRPRSLGQVERAGGGRAGADAAGAPGPEGFSARAVAVSLSCNPTPSAPLSFLARVAPSWGNQATRGAEALWCRETMAGVAHGSDAIGNRLDADRRRPRDDPCRGEARVGQCPPRRVSVRRHRPGSAPKPRSRSSVAPARSLPHPASPIGIGSTVAATAMPTRLSSGS